MYRIAICDDDVDFLNQFNKFIQDVIPQSEEVTIDQFQSGEELLEKFAANYDIIILDREMEGLSGSETAIKLREQDDTFILAFCTGISQTTPDLFDLDVSRYIVKHDSFEDNCKKINALIKECNAKNDAMWFIDAAKEKVQVYVKDILYVEKYHRKTKIHLCKYAKQKYEGCTIQINLTLPETYKLLQKFGFEYPHSSYIVNCFNIQKTDGRVIRFIDGEEVNIAKTKKTEFMRKMAKLR